MWRNTVWLLGVLATQLAWAADPAGNGEPPLFEETPAAPGEESLMEGETVFIGDDEQEVVKEYKAGGSVWMIEVRPTKGRPYYLIDGDGDGRFESRRSELGPQFRVPTWVIKRW